MTELEKMQKAIEITIAAGYQINMEAFEFLTTLASTQDPTEIVNKAIHEIEALEEKPLFIDRSFLEKLVQPLEPKSEIPSQLKDLPETKPDSPMVESKKEFRPYAKEIEPNLKIIDDPATKLSTSGKMEDYLEYFRDRFKRLEKLLRQRIDVRSAASIIDALKAPANAKLKIIGMITEKREVKQKILLTVEDLYANTTVLVPENQSTELVEKARCLLLDQVICLSVVKARSSLLIAEDIILPDVPQKPQHKASIPVYAALTSDMHVGSTKFHREAFKRFVLWLNGKYGNEKMREIASHVKYVLIAGDIVDGVGIYPNQIKELAIKDAYGQYRHAAKYLEQIPDYIEVILIPGNHDAPRKALPQPPLPEDFLKTLQESRKVYSQGNPCVISLHGVEVLIYHGRSLDDIIWTIPAMDVYHPEKAMKLLLQSRHLAPLYGGKTPLSPENRDSLVVEHVPDIFHAGHVHVLGYANYRGVLLVNSGGWQEQTDYMRRLGVVPTSGKVPVVNLQTLETMVVPFS